MITFVGLIASFVFFLLSLFFTLKYKKEAREAYYDKHYGKLKRKARAWDTNATIFFFVTIILLGVNIIMYSTQLSTVNRIIESNIRIEIAEEQLSRIGTSVIAELQAYPDFEREAYEAFIEAGDPNILLRFPELCSNIVIIEAAESHRQAIDRVFHEQRTLEERKRDLRTARDNFLVSGVGIDYSVIED